MENRERLSSRIGFILISVGCAVGLGNVWRFPYITGKYGGAAFVLIYLVFLVILGLPIMVMEFSVGRASKRSAARSFHVLEPEGSKWHIASWLIMAGNYVLMMFYTTVGGWMLIYIKKMMAGEFEGESIDTSAVFNGMLGSPASMVGGMLLVVVLGTAVCSIGLQKGVERVTKWMMSLLFVILLILCVRSVTLPGASEGLAFYLLPDFSQIAEAGVGNVLYAAMGQAFFTLSLGIGAMAIFGSYVNRERSLTGEALNVCVLDTVVAFLAGLVIFPACFAFDVNPGEGPGLVFVTLPNIFNRMAGGRVWGTLFFLFMSFAALSTVIAVFQNLISFYQDLLGFSGRKAALVNGIVMAVLSLPCALGFNVWSEVRPLGFDIQGFEDFIVSNNILPIGSLIYLMFCTWRCGWGWNKFTAEADTGNGMKFPKWARGYVTYILPVIVLVIFVMGYVQTFGKK